MRRLLASSVIAILAATLPVSAAAALTLSDPMGTVVGVSSEVNEFTPLYTLQVDFELEDVTCPAVVDFDINNGLRTAVIAECANGTGFHETATARGTRPMFGPGVQAIDPEGANCSGVPDGETGCTVSVFVRNPEVQPEPVTSQLRELRIGAAPALVDIPPRPLWVGIGDGYTSRTTQMADWCFETGPESVAAGEAAQGGNVSADAMQGVGAYVGDAYVGIRCTAAGIEVYEHDDGVFYDLYFRAGDPDDHGDYNSYAVAPNGSIWWWDENQDYDFVPAPETITIDLLEPQMGTGTYLTAGNLPRSSWINDVVTTFNDSFTIDGVEIPCTDPNDDQHCWRVVPEVIADSETTAADLTNDAHPQLAQLRALLAGDQADSWNWVGLSAGLLDAGIPQAIQDRYPRVDGEYQYESLASGYVPWRPTRDGDVCPAFPEVTEAVQGVITAGLTNVIEEARAASPGLKAIVVRYPWLTEAVAEETEVRNPCAVEVDAGTGDGKTIPANRVAIMALNAAVDAAIAPYQAGDDLFALNLAAEANLTEGFTDEPTDSVPGRPSYLQLTRPFGYPYPSDHGSSSMGTLAYKTIKESGLAPPTIDVALVQRQGDDSYLEEQSGWRATIGSETWYRARDLWLNWTWDTPEGFGGTTADPFVPLERGANRNYSNTVTDLAVPPGSATRTVTYSWDPDAPVISGSPRGGILGLNGWWRGAPTHVDWSVADDMTGYTTVHFPSGVTSTTLPATPVPVPSIGANVRVTSTTATDRAGNVSDPKDVFLNIDPIPPTVTGVPWPAGWSNADSASVTWTRTDEHSGLADTGTVGTDTKVVPLVGADGKAPEGLHHVTHTVSDRAGWSTTGEAIVRIDRTAPRVFMENGFSWKTRVEAEQVPGFLDDFEDYGCTGKDDRQPASVAASGYDRCTIEISEPVPTGENGWVTYTVTLDAWDKAGNKGTDVRTFEAEVIDPPELEGKYVTEANDHGWWNQDVRIDWTATPALGWGLHPVLGDLYSGNWNISGASGVGTYQSTHTIEGAYPAPSPDACHAPLGVGLCADPAPMTIKLDKTKPRVDPVVAPEPSSGWYKQAVTVDWDVADVARGGIEVSGIDSGSVPGPTTVDQGIRVVSTGEVKDKAGNVNSGSVEIKVDSVAPVIQSIDGVTAGELHTRLDTPDDVTCSAEDLPKADTPANQVSKVDANGCKVGGLPGDPIDRNPFGPPIREVTWYATATDVAGNESRSEVVTRLLDRDPGMNGRMTVGGHLDGTPYGRVTTTGTLRCNGSPNDLGVGWSGNSFTLEWIDYFYCWDEGDFEASPEAPIDTLYGEGKGRLADGREATIQWTFADREAQNLKGTMRIVIKVLGGTQDGRLMLDVGGALTGGQYQAHDAQGDGTNDNGNVNGPTGNTSNQSLTISAATVPAVVPSKPKLA